MEVFAEVRIRSKKGNSSLIDQLRQFCANTDHWRFDEKDTARYARDIGAAGCVLHLKEKGKDYKYALAEAETSGLYIANIICKQLSSIPITKYNTLSNTLTELLKIRSKQNKAGLKIDASKTDLDIEDIITAPIPLKLFRRYLGAHPLSYHPLDVERLHTAICAFTRYSRKRIDLNHLYLYLQEKERWPHKDAKWCVDRIDVGLQIISRYKKFYG